MLSQLMEKEQVIQDIDHVIQSKLDQKREANRKRIEETEQR